MFLRIRSTSNRTLGGLTNRRHNYRWKRSRRTCQRWVEAPLYPLWFHYFRRPWWPTVMPCGLISNMISGATLSPIYCFPHWVSFTASLYYLRIDPLEQGTTMWPGLYLLTNWGKRPVLADTCLLPTGKNRPKAGIHIMTIGSSYQAVYFLKLTEETVSLNLRKHWRSVSIQGNSAIEKANNQAR